MLGHVLNGNCYDAAFDCDECSVGEFCDVCHEHDEPRGDCELCEKCSRCELE